jgi:two-component system chemotaxis response regulator CheB
MDNGRRDIVTIGGSAGSLEPLKSVVENIPADLPAALFIVIHTTPRQPSQLVDLVNKVSCLPARQASDGEPILPGRIYLPPSDRHLMIAGNHIHVTPGAQRRPSPSEH